jgi:hypothetical protein
MFAADAADQAETARIRPVGCLVPEESLPATTTQKKNPCRFCDIRGNPWQYIPAAFVTDA